MLGLLVVVLDTVVVGVVVVIVLVLVVGAVVVGVTVVEGSGGVVVVVVLAAVVVLGLTRTNKIDMIEESDLCFLETTEVETFCNLLSLSPSQHSTLKIYS